MTDLVAMLNERDFNVQVALGQIFHNAADRPKRANQAATQRERDYTGDEQPRQTDCDNPDRPVENHRVDVVGVDASLDREQLVALTIPASVGEFRQLGPTRRLRYLIFEVAAAGAS